MKIINCDVKFVPEIGDKILWWDGKLCSQTIYEIARITENAAYDKKDLIFDFSYLYWYEYAKHWIFLDEASLPRKASAC